MFIGRGSYKNVWQRNVVFGGEGGHTNLVGSIRASNEIGTL